MQHMFFIKHSYYQRIELSNAFVCHKYCKGFTWGNFRNFECLYLIGVGYVAGGFPAVVILEILA